MPADAQPKVETQESADANMIDLPSDGPSVDVELPENKESKVDTQPQEQVVVEDSASQGEMDDYGKKVQSRIDKLTKKLRESERREQAAIEFAQGLQHEQTKLQQKTRQLDTGYVNEFASRVEAQTAEAKKQLKDAMDLGDIDAQVEAQQKIARLAVDADRAKKSLDQRERLKKEMEARGVDPNQPQMPTQQAQPQARPDPKAQDWAEENPWFGNDRAMTMTSFVIHQDLLIIFLHILDPKHALHQ